MCAALLAISGSIPCPPIAADMEPPPCLYMNIPDVPCPATLAPSLAPLTTPAPTATGSSPTVGIMALMTPPTAPPTQDPIKEPTAARLAFSRTCPAVLAALYARDRKSTRLNSSHGYI